MLIYIYILTAIISIIVGVWLANLAKLSARAKLKYERKETQTDSVTVTPVDEALSQTINAELMNAVDSAKDRQEISQRLSDFFNKELQKKLDSKGQEMTTKYEALIAQKSQNEEMAWKKYKTILGDKKKTEAVIRSIAEGLLVVDSAGRVIMMNPAAEKLLGVSRKNQLGRPVIENLKEEQLVTLAKGSATKEGDKEIELISRDDETKKTLRASSAVIEDENGQTVGMVSVLSDITKQKELDQLKATFVANVSHELRSPLVATEKAISLILSKSTGELSENQEQFLTIAQRNLKRLTIIINDLLDLSKLEAGKVDLKREPTSLEVVINEAVEGLSVWAGTKRISIEKRIGSGLPRINIDPGKIIQVLNNLIGNAIKFTPSDGKIAVEAILREQTKGIEVSVRDTGLGIDENDLHKVFDKFYQSGERVATDVSGTGIGLSIAREMVELHGGKIWAESEKGKGAKFTFILPL